MKCANCSPGKLYPGFIILTEEDSEGELRCVTCQKVIDHSREEQARTRVAVMTNHLRQALRSYDIAVRGDVYYRGGLLQQLKESLARLIALDAELTAIQSAES